MPESVDAGYAAWFAGLQQRACERGLEWMVAAAPGAHRAAYDNCLSADDELSTLEDMAQWRGCGCGGGG